MKMNHALRRIGGRLACVIASLGLFLLAFVLAAVVEIALSG